MRVRGLVASCSLIASAACGDDATYIDAAPPVDARWDGAAAPDANAPAPDAAPPDAGPAVLTSTVSITPGLGSLCGAGFDPVDELVWVYPCSGATVHAFTPAGVAAGTVDRPGEAANDVDLAFTPVGVVIGTAAVAAGGMLFVNGETDSAEVHLPDTAGAPPLTTGFGGSHVVGGGYHPARDTLFLVQDRVAAAEANVVAELDRVTGAVLGSFSTLPAFDVNYGDLEVCAATGHLFLVSSFETTIAELSPTGAVLAEHVLPDGVISPAGIGLGPDGQAWVAGTGGELWRVDGVPCPSP
jgi:hypothetical protein